jgi:hypothetical protein
VADVAASTLPDIILFRASRPSRFGKPGRSPSEIVRQRGCKAVSQRFSAAKVGKGTLKCGMMPDE